MSGRRLPPLHALRAFEAAARHGSMTQASHELSVTPGAVSRHVRGLELAMDTQLFIRSATGLSLTGAGAALADELSISFDRIAEAAKGVKLRQPRRLTLGVYGFFASGFLLPRWTRLRQDLPGLMLDLHTSTSPLDLIPSRFDAVIAVSDGAERSGLVTHRLMPIRTMPVCSPALLADGPVDLATAHLLHSRARPDDWRRWLDHAGFRAVTADRGSSFEGGVLAIEAAKRQHGIAIGIEALVQSEFEAGTLVAPFDKLRPTRGSFALMVQPQMADDADMRAFTGWLLDQV
ncbi:hypothetical protein ATO6_11715 [Oceanicola sp. 22II-s10i]|uniref:LysR substrate-binding domain-containing protein n=1 Tax=Oceanicola sp. 22II-s10i TaxID=1317116 RepID=UPI000B7535ED|nr:LysR substrate-binding domain-containing protein [Oceanicola sp. 22II-s10i]OWU84376.1 hypothetical protein ATO6_11715 [Oceanicola sp. 22II-s10i]